jgi:hypothetical protein
LLTLKIKSKSLFFSNYFIFLSQNINYLNEILYILLNEMKDVKKYKKNKKYGNFKK